jgi:ectoine hydroxylase-related dioxygenase (phytanoyl-CoA dioxygenase family)
MSTHATDTLRAELDALATDGLVVLREVLGAGEIAAIKDALALYLDGTHMGRNRFEGLRTQRVYALLAKSPVFGDLVSHPRVLRLLDELLQPNYLLSAALAIHLGPGGDRQELHFDDGFYSWIPRPRRSVGVSVIWAIDEFTDENGATEVVPGSHLWGDERAAADDPRICPVIMPAGSAVVFQGTLWHRGGANRSKAPRLAITPQYCQPWARQMENMTLAVPFEIAATYPRPVQELIGYSIHPPFMGHVNGLHPARLIDPDYKKRDRVEARRANEMLERPR